VCPPFHSHVEYAKSAHCGRRYCYPLRPMALPAGDRDKAPGADWPESTTLHLVDRVKHGDPEALEVLVGRFLPRLRRWASGRLPVALRDLADTSDLVQDVLLQSFKKIKGLDTDREGGLQAYLRQAILNRIRDEFRKAKRRPEVAELPPSLPADGPSPLEAAIGRQALDRYEAALAELRPTDREAIIARIELGCTYDEVAELLGKPTANAARMAVERALVRLIDRLRT
jgi:RNA polymerase sigma-70 factor, ECF subfamily